MPILNQIKSVKQKGVSMVETMIILPVILILGFGIVHAGLIFQAQSNLEYAALMAARVGASSSINIEAMQTEVLRRMAASDAKAAAALGDASLEAPDVEITILNPTRTMFQNCGVTPTYTPEVCDFQGGCEIPNFGLQFRNQTCDGLATVQDANILRIRVRYGFDSKVPFMDWIRFPTSDPAHPDEDKRVIISTDPQEELNGYPVTAVATVRMQSPARLVLANQEAFPD